MASETLFGVLLDVSRSMESAYALDRSHDASVPRIHSIFTTIVNIIRREVARRDRRDSIFACTFGLETYTCGPSCTGICDMISLLDCPKDGHQALVDLARKEEAPHAERWIKNQLSHSEAQILYTILCRDRRSTLELIELLPRRVTTAATDAASWAGNAAEKVPLFGWLFAKPVNDWAGKKMERKVSDSEAYKFTHKMIDKFWQQQPRPRPVREVSEKLEKLLGDPSTTSSQSIHDQIDEFVKQIEPFIFGRTPMRKALKDAQAVFRHANEKQKVLCIISDGDSTDGDPRYIAQNLREKGVDIATCFLTSDHIGKPRRLIYDPDPNWPEDDTRRVLFQMSSIMKNTHTPISYLVDADWELSQAGESHLFIQANSLDVVNEFCRIVISQLSKPCNALVDVIEKVNLADLINVTNAEFPPTQQHEDTCYASACAAVLNLAMHRIVGREGGIPGFKELRKKLIAKYGEDGKRSEVVLNEVCPEYRLHVRTVDETGARKAINERRPVVARFSLFNEQWKMFMKFYKEKPKGILKKENIEGQFLAM